MGRSPLPYLYLKAYRRVVPRLNPAQHRLFRRHVDRAVEALREGDRLLKGVLHDVVERMVAAIEAEAAGVDRQEANTVKFELDKLPLRLVSYLEDPFAQSLAFNLYCERTRQSHSQAQTAWDGGQQAVAARNLLFLPPAFRELWKAGHIEKTRLVAIANRNLKPEAYKELADMVRTRRKEDVDERLLKIPATFLQVGRRGPAEAMDAARKQGWVDVLRSVEIPAELVMEAASSVTETDVQPVDDDHPVEAAAPRAERPADQAGRALRAGLGGAKLAPEVQEALNLSPNPVALVDKYLAAHRKTKDGDPAEVTKTLFFAHAGPMQRLVADDKLLLRHFRPVKTQKRGQLFYRLLEVIEEALLAKQDRPEAERGLTETEAIEAVRTVLIELNKDPNRYLVLPDDWLGEVTRRHLYFGSRTRKEGAAYKWFRKIGSTFYLGAYKTADELAERQARRDAKHASDDEE